MTTATESPLKGWWAVEGDVELTRNAFESMREALSEAAIEGKEVIVVDGVTLHWYPVIVHPPRLDPEDRTRLIRVSTDLLSQFGTRTERGERITAEWGEPDADGIYEPTFTAHTDPSEPDPTGHYEENNA
jgi:hypothetical protein